MNLHHSPRLCPICFTFIENQETLIILPECHHIFCKDCFIQYLQTEISTLRALKIKCPQEGCSHPLNTSLLQELLSPETFQIYQKRIVDKVQSFKASEGQHYCPKSGCSELLHLTPDTKSTSCICGACICNECGDFYHEGKTCFEALDPEFEAYVESNNIRFCFMCKTKMTRVEGCTHITCPICDYEWCWLCGQEHDQYHAKICSRNWNPTLPDIIMQDEIRNHQEQSFSMRILKLIIYLILEQAFWPFFQKNIQRILLSQNINLAIKIGRFLAALYANAIYFYAFIFVKWMMLQFPNPDSTRIFQMVFLILIIVPWLVKAIVYYQELQEQKKRWRSRDWNTFGYTKKSIPNKLKNQNHDVWDSDFQDDDVILELKHYEHEDTGATLF